MIFIYTEKFLNYKEEGHPEGPERLKAIVDYLRKKGIKEFVEPIPCTEEDLKLVHTEDLINSVKNNDFFDSDTPNLPGIYEYAALSVGAAIMAAEFSAEGKNAFSLSRPPGHHAGRNTLGGFCYFNNMAVAVKKLLSTGKKVSVLDLDGHHGNGTEEILRNFENVIYVSIHQYPAYPGTGSVSFGNCYNFPVYPNSTSKKYMEKFYQAIEIIKKFNPDILGISLGFDAHMDDPLLEMPLSESEYYFMGKEIGKLGINFFIILEGGYNTQTIGKTCYCFISGLMKKGGKENEEDNGKF